MSSLFRPRRWPYDPNDPEQDQQDQSMYAPGPEVGPAGGPPPPTPTPVNRPAAAEASMFQPNPTGPMPSRESLQGDAMQNATRSLYAPAQQDQAPPPSDRTPYSKPLERPEPAPHIPYPSRSFFTPTRSLDSQERNIDRMNAHNDEMYKLRLAAYEAEQRRLMEGGFYRNQPRLSPPYQKMVDGVPHNFAVNTISGEEHDLGEAPPSSKNVPRTPTRLSRTRTGRAGP